MAQIDLMIAGAQKAGTTSLKNYLGTHPGLITHQALEFAFFVDDQEYREGFMKALKRYFPVAASFAGKKIVAKNAGIYSNGIALQRLQQHNPLCEIILVLRNPVDRAYSSYNMERESGWYTKPWNNISASLRDFKNGERDQMFRLFIELGLYAEQLKKIYHYFPQKQVELILFEELKSHPAMVCAKVFKKAGLDSSIVPDTSRIFNPTKKVRSKKMGKFLIWLMDNENPLKKISKKVLPQRMVSKLGNLLFKANTSTQLAVKEKMPESIRRQLIDFFKPYNEELEAMTGLNLKHWDE